MIAVLVIVAIFVVLFIVAGFKIVQQSDTMVIERLGKYNRTLGSGVNVVWPILDRARKIDWRFTEPDMSGDFVVKRRQVTRIDLRETIYDFTRQNVITRDNVVVEIDALVYFQVTDAVRAVYEIANLPDAIEKLTKTTLRNVIGEMDLDETLSSRDHINNKLRSILDEATDKWGVKVNRVELQDINPPQDIRDAMEKQMRAERDRRAAILVAEGRKRSTILDAEGVSEAEIKMANARKQATILTAGGEAEAVRLMAEAEAGAISIVSDAFDSNQGDPASYLIAMRYIEALKEMVAGKGNKVVFLPYEATGILGSLGSIRELFDKTPPPPETVEGPGGRPKPCEAVVIPAAESPEPKPEPQPEPETPRAAIESEPEPTEDDTK